MKFEVLNPVESVANWVSIARNGEAETVTSSRSIGVMSARFKKQQQARVTRLQTLHENKRVPRVNLVEERVVLTPTVHCPEAVKLFARKTRLHDRRFTARKPTARRVRRDDETLFIQTKRGATLAFCSRGFSTRFFLNASQTRGELL